MSHLNLRIQFSKTQQKEKYKQCYVGKKLVRLSPGCSRNKVNFLPSRCYSTVFWI